MLEPKKKKKKIATHKLDSDKKERHIVTWTPQEDDVLREQARVHGTDNWSIIASKFMGKTTRQCRRRWYTYLNSDFKKGGWSPEEDLLLCEAQKIFGNRWTEIAKVVTGRTDNAVKNRFTTLCKKRAKCEALAKETNASCINQNGKRVTICSTPNSSQATGSTPVNKMLRRAYIQDASSPDDQLPRLPMAVAPESHPTVEEMVCNKGDIFKYCNPEIDLQLQNFKGMVEHFATKNGEVCKTAWRQQSNPDKVDEVKGEGKKVENMLHINPTGETSGPDEHGEEFFPSAMVEPGCCRCHKNTLSEYGFDYFSFLTIFVAETVAETVASVSVSLGKGISSPLQVTPVFRSFAAGIPSPKFSESERNFLMKTLRMESLSPSSSTNPVHPPSCKRALLQSL
ncbi:hypothetical protein SAY87_005343 [Trapa incisa]|uniref:Uncharacterized protein n=1 Tax=Trapa incisa TaxID=236973 RepID=A0AAN7KCA2_9MYRT|nr:hypothetical protein SAY87_005343 [Trapa incisa]